MSNVQITLKKRMRKGEPSPVLHVLMPDGRVTEFKDRGIVIPEEAGPVFALLIDKDGNPFVTPDGEPAVVAVPVIQPAVLPDPDKLLNWNQMAERAGVPLSTAKRMVKRGELPKPDKRREGGRAVGVRQGDVDAALKQRATKRSAKK